MGVRRLKLFLFVVFLLGAALLCLFLYKKYFSYPNRVVVGTIEELNNSSIAIRDIDGNLKSFRLSNNTVFTIGDKISDHKEVGDLPSVGLGVSISSFYRGVAGFVAVHQLLREDAVGTIRSIEGNLVTLNNDSLIQLDKDVVLTTSDEAGDNIEASRESLVVGSFIVVLDKKIENDIIIATKIHIFSNDENLTE